MARDIDIDQHHVLSFGRVEREHARQSDRTCKQHAAVSAGQGHVVQRRNVASKGAGLKASRMSCHCW